MRKFLKRAGVCLLSASMILTGNVSAGAVGISSRKGAAVETKTGSIVIDGNDIKADNVNGLTYKGFGMLSANSTSDLLMDYKSQNPEKYAQLMQYLFGGQYPIFTHVKLEMGNDRNNSTGAESSTMRTKDEKANVLRNPGWQLAADAKKINPDVKVSILSWRTPTWVKKDEDKYYWYKESILAAYEEYGYMVDYINPNTNEAWTGSSDVNRTKLFAKWIKEENKESIPDEKELELFHKIKLVVSDEANVVSDAVAQQLKKDKEFMDATDVVGYHYKTADDNNGGMKWLADEVDKEVWNSEEQATFSNSAFRPATTDKSPTVEGTGIGGSGSALEMGNTVIKSFVESRRSHVIYQPAIGSYYEGAQYSFKELVSARDPWSGWMHYDAGLLILAHISKFAVTGWENETNTAGIWRGIPSASKTSAIQGTNNNSVNGRGGGENYMTLAAPAKDNFSTVIVNDSEYPMTYTLQTKNMNLKADQKLELWETRAADEGAFNENYMKCIEELSADDNGVYSFEVKPNSAVTVTSLDVSDSKEHTQTMPVEGKRTVLDTDATGDVQNTEDDYLYADDFEYKGKTVPVLDGKGGFTGETEDYIASRGGDTGAIARYTHTLNGAFEVYKDEDGNHVLRQQVDEKTTGVGTAWNRGDPVTLIGDFRWMNYTASIDVMFEKEADNQYAQIGIRQTGRTHNILNNSGYSLKVNDDGTWTLYRAKLGSTSGKNATELASGSAINAGDVAPGTWFNLKLRGEGNVIKAYLNDSLIASYEDDNPITSGRIAIGCGSSFTRFDNLAVTKIKGHVPYYKEYIDNMETYDLSAQRRPKLIYNDKWSRTCENQDMYVYQRSASYSTDVGATLTYTFKGTGLELLGYNKSDKNAINVVVDGEVYKTGEKLWQSDKLCTMYQLSGLEYAKHTVTIEVASGGIGIDAVAVLGSVNGDEGDDEEPEVNTPIPSQSAKPSVSVSPSGQPSQLPSAQPSQAPSLQPSVSPDSPVAEPSIEPSNKPQQTAASTLQKGYTFKIKGVTYTVIDSDKKTVSLKKISNKKITSAVIPATVKTKIDGNTQTLRVTEISAKAFAGCAKLKKITIGKNITTIGKEAFAKDKSLKKLIIKSNSLTKIGKNAVKGIDNKAKISCGSKKVKAYKKLFTAKTGYKKSMKITK